MLAIELQYLLTVQADFEITVTGFEVLRSICLCSTWRRSLKTMGMQRRLVRRPSCRCPLRSLDPWRPYGVCIDGPATENGKTKHREFEMECGEMHRDEFVALLSRALGRLAEHSKNGSFHFAFMSWHHLKDLLMAGDTVYDALLNIVVWVKDCAGMGSGYRSQHEFCSVFRNGKASHQYAARPLRSQPLQRLELSWLTEHVDGKQW
jgi:hypothetical protein